MQKAIDDRLYLDFLYQVNNGEIKQYYDVLGVHPGGYNNPPDDFLDRKTVASTTFKGHGSFYIRRYQQLREVQLKHGDDQADVVHRGGLVFHLAGRPRLRVRAGQLRGAPGGSTSPACWSRSPPRPPT